MSRLIPAHQFLVSHASQTDHLGDTLWHMWKSAGRSEASQFVIPPGSRTMYTMPKRGRSLAVFEFRRRFRFLAAILCQEVIGMLRRRSRLGLLRLLRSRGWSAIATILIQEWIAAICHH